MKWLWIKTLAALFCLSAVSHASVLVIDTFDERSQQNALKGASGVWGEPGDASANCSAIFDTDNRVSDFGHSLRLEYDIESIRENVQVPTNVSIQNPARLQNAVYNGYYSIIGPRDLRPYRYLHLSVKGDTKNGFSRSFRLELKEEESASGVLIEGITDRWQNFVVALDRFKDLRDLSRIKEFVIVFGPDFVTRKTGTLYFDDIYLSSEADDTIRLPRREYAAKKSVAPPVIDGKLNEWPQRDFVTLSARKGNLESGKIRNQADLNAWFALSWDDQRLYVAVDVQDDDVMNRQSAAELWKDDAVEVYIDPHGDGLAWNNPDDFQLGFSPISATNEPELWSFFQRRVPEETEVEVATHKYRDGYQVEMAIAWTFLRIDPSRNNTLGFTAAVHDRDSRDASSDAKLNWSFQPMGEARTRLGKLVLQ